MDMRRTLILLVATTGLWACGTGGDDGGSGGGSGSSSGLAGLLKGFGKAANGTGGEGGSGGGPIGTDGGLPVGGGSGGGASSSDCSTICARVMQCIPEGGCPNFGRLPDAQMNEVIAACVPACQQGLTDEALAEVNAATCTEIYQEISAGEPEVQAFCALEPASDADCSAFCQQLSMCGGEVTNELCQLTCLYGDGVRCILQNGTCNAPECAPYFPSD